MLIEFLVLYRPAPISAVAVKNHETGQYLVTANGKEFCVVEDMSNYDISMPIYHAQAAIKNIESLRVKAQECGFDTPTPLPLGQMMP